VQTVIPVAQWVGLSSCAVNPVVYCLFSAKFRDGFRRLLVTEPCCSCRSQANTPAGGARRSSAGVTTGRLVATLVDHETSRPQVRVTLQMRAMANSLLTRYRPDSSETVCPLPADGSSTAVGSAQSVCDSTAAEVEC